METMVVLLVKVSAERLNDIITSLNVEELGM